MVQVLYFATSLSSTAGFCMWEELGKSQQELLTVKMIWFSGMRWSSTALPEKAITVSPCGTVARAHWEGFSSVTAAWSRVAWKQMGTYRSGAHTAARRQSGLQNEQMKTSCSPRLPRLLARSWDDNAPPRGPPAMPRRGLPLLIHQHEPPLFPWLPPCFEQKPQLYDGWATLIYIHIGKILLSNSQAMAATVYIHWYN